MMKIDKTLYKKIVLKLIRYSNTIAVLMMLIGIYVCFSPNAWLYVIILGISSSYLGWLTCQYVISESQNCNTSCNLQYGCQIASFNSRLSIVSNAAISLFGLAFTGLTIYYILNPKQVAIKDNLNIVNLPYIVGFFKLMLMYILSDKIHSLQLLISVLYRYSQSIRFLNIDLDKNKMECRYPLIFLDKSRISDRRYYVTAYPKYVNVVFNPTLSINDESIIEYQFIQEDDNHKVHAEPLYDIYDQPTCFFRCHVVVKGLDVHSNNQ